MHVGVNQALPGRSRGLQGPPGASQGPPGGSRGFQDVYEMAAPKFHAGWSGWTGPPTMAGGGGPAAETRLSRE